MILHVSLSPLKLTNWSIIMISKMQLQWIFCSNRKSKFKIWRMSVLVREHELKLDICWRLCFTSHLYSHIFQPLIFPHFVNKPLEQWHDSWSNGEYSRFMLRIISSTLDLNGMMTTWSNDIGSNAFVSNTLNIRVAAPTLVGNLVGIHARRCWR